jgi:hypothetical protein
MKVHDLILLGNNLSSYLKNRLLKLVNIKAIVTDWAFGTLYLINRSQISRS